MNLSGTELRSAAVCLPELWQHYQATFSDWSGHTELCLPELWLPVTGLTPSFYRCRQYTTTIQQHLARERVDISKLYCTMLILQNACLLNTCCHHADLCLHEIRTLRLIAFGVWAVGCCHLWECTVISKHLFDQHAFQAYSSAWRPTWTTFGSTVAVKRGLGSWLSYQPAYRRRLLSALYMDT
jgi:hypothetical protein